MCHHVFMYCGRGKNKNSQINSSIKYISKTHESVIQNEIYCNYDADTPTMPKNSPIFHGTRILSTDYSTVK